MRRRPSPAHQSVKEGTHYTQTLGRSRLIVLVSAPRRFVRSLVVLNTIGSSHAGMGPRARTMTTTFELRLSMQCCCHRWADFYRGCAAPFCVTIVYYAHTRACTSAKKRSSELMSLLRMYRVHAYFAISKYMCVCTILLPGRFLILI